MNLKLSGAGLASATIATVSAPGSKAAAEIESSKKPPLAIGFSFSCSVQNANPIADALADAVELLAREAALAPAAAAGAVVGSRGLEDPDLPGSLEAELRALYRRADLLAASFTQEGLLQQLRPKLSFANRYGDTLLMSFKVDFNCNNDKVYFSKRGEDRFTPLEVAAVLRFYALLKCSKDDAEEAAAIRIEPKMRGRLHPDLRALLDDLKRAPAA
eukprot:tig00020927_g16007.t1